MLSQRLVHFSAILSERDPEVVGSQLPLATPSGLNLPSREGNPATPGLFPLLATDQLRLTSSR
jgi:hypothetical protein